MEIGVSERPCYTFHAAVTGYGPRAAHDAPRGPVRFAGRPLLRQKAHLKISTEKIPDSQVLMTIEVEPERLNKAREKAVRKLAPRAKVPGFRPGKAPPDMVRRYFGEERVLDEALDDLVPDLYREAVDADDTIIPIARPRLVIETTEPLVVKATIPVRPTVELGDYKGVRIEPEVVEVDEARVEETLTALRRRVATLEPTDRPIRYGDVVRLDVHAHIDGNTLIEQQEAEIQLVEGRPAVFPGFEEEMIGASKGDERTFDLAVPEGFAGGKFEGKQAHFTARIIETKEEVLPELTDDFAREVGEGFETVDALRDRIRDDIRRREEDERENRYHDRILVKLVEQATVEYPPVMLDAEVDRMLHDSAGHMERGQDLERYLASIGKTEEEVRTELAPVADTRLRRSLVLSQVAEAEDIQVADADVDEEVAKLSLAAGQQAAQFQQLFASENGRDTIRRNLVTRRTLERLVDVAVPGAAEEREARRQQDEEREAEANAKIAARMAAAVAAQQAEEAEEPAAGPAATAPEDVVDEAGPAADEPVVAAEGSSEEEQDQARGGRDAGGE